ncbi:hypothetical protein KEJ51_06795 [Candidatus Bathyarchaeota archaeon]|nr:hypothetical protein [Candidatus Bathyarchaeota archaeon]MBS7629014.1 hypothetical protein [Candidatus Bathyarchaeota archaeon]
MNERCLGALEALGYVRRFVEGLGSDSSVRLRVLRELDELIDLLLNGSVADFRSRIERY